MNIRKALLCALVSSLLGCSHSPQPSPQPSPRVAKLKPRKLVVRYSCDDALALIADKAKYATLTADNLNEVTAVVLTCNAKSYNKEHPDDPRTVVIAPVADDPNQKVEMRTVPLHDFSQIRDVCYAAGTAYFAYAETVSTATPITKAIVTGVDVVTDSGHTDCNSFVHGAEVENPLVVFAPSVISGSGVSMRVLNMIGAGDAANQVQAAVDQVGAAVKDTGAQTVQDVVKNPLHYVPPDVQNIGPVVIVTPPLPPGMEQKKKELEDSVGKMVKKSICPFCK
jgi:hypothetical protein